MFVFEPNCRVQKTNEGIQFYEQDVLCFGYDFFGNQRIEIKLDYVSPGFGVLLIENNNSELKEVHNSYLFKMGSNDFRVYQKHFKKQEQVGVSSCAFTPGPSMKNVVLVFEIIDRLLSVYRQEEDSAGKHRESLLAEYELNKLFESYRIGIYSNAGNTIRSISLLNSIPKHWRASIKNTMGGRIAFRRNRIRFENCEHHGEVEQKNILLEPGTYWLKYETEKVNGECDIIPYVLDSTDPGDGLEQNLEDEFKNLLQEDNTFVLDQSMPVNFKVKAHNGIIKNIFITENKHSSYIETKDNTAPREGSIITINLKNLKKVMWEATIQDVPPWEDFTKDCPYAIVDNGRYPYNLQDLRVKLNKRYRYTYEVDKELLSVYDIEADKDIMKISCSVVDNKIIIMKNVTGIIFKLVLTDISGNEIDIMVRKTFKKYLSSAITSPIIITHTETNESFDLSSSYREVVIPKKAISLFSKEHVLMLKEEVPINANDIHVYGIPYGTRIDVKAIDIDKFASKYDLISEDDYTRAGNSVNIPDSIRNTYEYIAIQYNTLKNFFYEFTNYEREIFETTHDVLSLEHPLAIRDTDIIIYGIPKDTIVHNKYLYRVPSSSLINSIDYYADNYEIIPPNLYTVNYSTYEILVNDKLIDGRYQHFIVDYLKKDSYAINYRSEHFQYEVDIATEDNQVKLHYDMHDDGSISDYIRTEISPDKDKYIIIKPRGKK